MNEGQEKEKKERNQKRIQRGIKRKNCHIKAALYKLWSGKSMLGISKL